MQKKFKYMLLLSALMVGQVAGLNVLAAEKGAKRMPFSLALGKSTYNKSCMECHGKDGVGGDKGPTLMHKYYEPSHHSDTSFYRAMTTGVRQHHWEFGDMEPVPGLGEKKMRKIIEYVRWLQRQQGIGN
jgi:cytochrome c